MIGTTKGAPLGFFGGSSLSGVVFRLIISSSLISDLYISLLTLPDVILGYHLTPSLARRSEEGGNPLPLVWISIRVVTLRVCDD
jgi:hypothetical protein